MGRTGLVGKGLLRRWGPNHAAGPIATRYVPVMFYLLLIVRKISCQQRWSFCTSYKNNLCNRKAF